MLSKLRIPLMAMALGAVAMTAKPATASAQSCAASVTLGFGGFFSGCYSSFDVARFFENAGDVSNMYWFAGMPTRNATTNAPTSASGSLLFNNDCGSSGNNSTSGQFCSNMQQGSFNWGLNLELVFGLNNLAKGTWLYSGTDPNRNNPPPPAGVQNWLWEIVGGTYNGWYLFGWEDLNSGCVAGTAIGGGGSLQPNQLDGTTLDAARLGANVVTCTRKNSGGTADNDYNDFYVLVRPHLQPDTPTEVVPEPMTMTLLATGLLGMGGASMVRRRRSR